MASSAMPLFLIMSFPGWKMHYHDKTILCFIMNPEKARAVLCVVVCNIVWSNILKNLLITMVRVSQRFVISIMMCFMDAAKSLSTLGHEF